MCSGSNLEIIDTYTENGIEIKVLKGFTEVKSKIHSPKPYEHRPVTHRSTYYNKLLKDWCDVRFHRMQDLADNSPLSFTWFAKRKYGSKYLSKEVFEEIVQPAMLKTEQQEAMNNSLSKRGNNK